MKCEALLLAAIHDDAQLRLAARECPKSHLHLFSSLLASRRLRMRKQ